MPGVLVWIATTDGTADEVSLQALTLGRELAGGDGSVHALVVAGDGPVPEPAAGLGAWGVSHMHVARHPDLAAFAPDAIAGILDDLAARLAVRFVVGPGTDPGNTVLARTAARSGLPFAAGCVAVTPGDPVTVSRIRWGGSVLEHATIRSERVLLTVAPHAVAATPAGAPGAPIVEEFTPELDAADLVVRVVERVPAASAGVSLAEAKVVVSGGRGVGSAAGFGPIEELAGLLGAAVGCSRAATIAGWRSHTAQVGQTGTRIAPELYIVCGISGATQHLAGCKGAKRILAINTDREAPIMSAADHAVIGDLHEVLPAISAQIRRVRGAKQG